MTRGAVTVCALVGATKRMIAFVLPTSSRYLRVAAPSSARPIPNSKPYRCIVLEHEPGLPSRALAKKAISPHVIRHTTATHLLRAGVDINTIRAWLGHVSIDTTNVYAEVDLETKAQMLAACGSFTSGKVTRRRWRDDPSLMQFLRSL